MVLFWGVFLIVSDTEKSILTINLSIGPLNPHFNWNMVIRCEPKTYSALADGLVTVSSWPVLCMINSSFINTEIAPW